MTNPGAQLAAMRKMTEKHCEVCGAVFVGMKRKTTCEICRTRAKSNAYNKRKLEKLAGIENTDEWLEKVIGQKVLTDD